MVSEAGRRVERVLHLPDLCLLAAGRASTNDFQMKPRYRTSLRLIDERHQGRAAVSPVVLMVGFVFVAFPPEVLDLKT